MNSRFSLHDSSSDSNSDESDPYNIEPYQPFTSLFELNNPVSEAIGEVRRHSQLVIPEILNPPQPPCPINRRTYIDRGREGGHARIVDDYFTSGKRTFTDDQFRRRFRMRRPLFEMLVREAQLYDEFFVRRPDATGRMGLSALQKCVASIRVIAYGSCADSVDEYCRISETSTRNSLERFCDFLYGRFSEDYMRRVNVDDVTRLLQINGRRGFPGMIGSIDCMHWSWENCPNAWKGQFRGKEGKPTVVLEAVASKDLWIWHSFFGVPGKLNDVNVLQRSPVFDDLLKGAAPAVEFVVNGKRYNMAYYLTDGIYPAWSTFVPAIKNPATRKECLFTNYQESCRKDVERAFGVLKRRFLIIKHPCLSFTKELMGKIMNACIILHNLIIEDERDTVPNYDDPRGYDEDIPNHTATSSSAARANLFTTPNMSDFTCRESVVGSMEDYFANRRDMRNRTTHATLQKDLIEHIWSNFGPRT